MHENKGNDGLLLCGLSRSIKLLELHMRISFVDVGPSDWRRVE